MDGAGGGLAVRVTDSIILPVPASRIDRYGKYKGREMVLGLRPEHLFEYHETGRPGWARVDLPVDVVEPMGMETMVHFFIDGDAGLRPRRSRHPCRAGRDAAADRGPEPDAPDGAGQRPGGVVGASPHRH